ncbi:60S ribosomal protein L35, partial [Coemansia sp. S17]
QARSDVRGQYAGKKYIPKDLRAKKTRALRRALTKNELSRKTLRQQKKEDNFPIREFAIKA